MAKGQSGWDRWREKKAREAKRSMGKAHKGYILIAVLFLAFGLTLGYFGASFITKNDAFEIKGEKVTVCKVGETVTYADEGIKYISFGKDRSESFTVETDIPKNGDGEYAVDTSKAGEYCITYRAVGGRCDGLTLYRVFRVIESTEGGAAE